MRPRPRCCAAHRGTASRPLPPPMSRIQCGVGAPWRRPCAKQHGDGALGEGGRGSRGVRRGAAAAGYPGQQHDSGSSLSHPHPRSSSDINPERLAQPASQRVAKFGPERSVPGCKRQHCRHHARGHTVQRHPLCRHGLATCGGMGATGGLPVAQPCPSRQLHRFPVAPGERCDGDVCRDMGL